MKDLWHISVDTGGTFTDCIAHDPDGSTHRLKVLSSGAVRGVLRERLDARTFTFDAGWISRRTCLDRFFVRIRHPGGSDFTSRIRLHEPGSQRIHLADAADYVQTPATIEFSTGEVAPILAARLVSGTTADADLPRVNLRLATTRGTNALLERRGSQTALFITRGFADLLLIGDQQRPDLFTLRIDKPAPLPSVVVEVDERRAADGTIVRAVDLELLRRDAAKAKKNGATAAAIALMHSYLDDSHERGVAELLREVGFETVSCSSELAPLIGLLPRCETAVVDSYLATTIRSYVEDVGASLGAGSRIHVMTSAGGLVEAGAYRAKDSLLSGPAGGVAGAAAVGRASGFEKVIGFDMGGTSTDVARVDGDFEYRFEQKVAEVRLLSPALAIETVAAGGGSICDFKEDRLVVGPHSAGADPGPACYGAGGPLTLTDVNLLLGRINPEQFEIPLDRAASRAALDEVKERIRAGGGDLPPDDALLDGFLAIANERMAGAIERISLRRGYDPASYALVSFGGAGGQHACAVAAQLGIRTVLMPRDASILSAVGLSQAPIERFSQKQVLKPLDEIQDDLAALFQQCIDAATTEVEREGIQRDSITVRRRLANMRLMGQDATVTVDVDDLDCIGDEFAGRYESIYGIPPEGKPIELESIRVVVSSTTDQIEQTAPTTSTSGPAQTNTVPARFAGAWCAVPAMMNDALLRDSEIKGPALIFGPGSAYVIEDGWTVQVDDAGTLVVTQPEASPALRDETHAELARAELFTHRLTSIAEEMGQILQRTALSTNVKQRLDFSCGVLDAEGRFVVNAPHIPVHLGALGLCVRSVIANVVINPGDVLITNHPALGGSHLPDITVITPVFADDSLLGFVACRAHHAEVGGSRPGSMPPRAQSLAEEGVVIPPQHMVNRGESRFSAIESLLRAGPYPSRAVADNLADLRAAVAANRRGAALFAALASAHGAAEIRRRMDQMRARARRGIEAAIRSREGTFEAQELLDDGSPLRVKITFSGAGASFDFTGSAGQHAGNLNATPAIVHSAVLYVMRLLIGEPLPLNDGMLEPVEIILPRGILNPEFNDDPNLSPAVVGGNTETSQRLVDTLLKALRVCACSQGTMNNFVFGTDAFGYYETICGGSGAGRDFHGADAVHTHMTNTRMTDPEIVEHRYDVRVEGFCVRRGSGGKGMNRGGDGVRREIRFLEPMALTVLTQHRCVAPYGMDGGADGARGRQIVYRAGGETIELGSIDQCDVEPGDRIVIETPGGGGWGAPAGDQGERDWEASAEKE